MVLRSLGKQTQQNFEVLVSDDGSTAQTASLLTHTQSSLPFKIQHIWQEDQGFRAAKIRNKAVSFADGEYLIFMDGDCVAPPNFVRRHQQLAETKYFLAG